MFPGFLEWIDCPIILNLSFSATLPLKGRRYSRTSCQEKIILRTNISISLKREGNKIQHKGFPCLLIWGVTRKSLCFKFYTPPRKPSSMCHFSGGPLKSMVLKVTQPNQFLGGEDTEEKRGRKELVFLESRMPSIWTETTGHSDWQSHIQLWVSLEEFSFLPEL